MWIHDNLSFHSMSNPYDKLAVTLHIYAPYKETVDLYDLKGGNKKTVNYVYYQEKDKVNAGF